MALFGGASRSVKLYLNVDSSGLERGLIRSEVRLKKFERVAGRSSTLNSSLLGGVGRGGAIAAGAGLAVIGLKSITDAAKNSQVILGQTSVAVQDAGLSWEQYGKQVENAALSISRSSAFDDEAVLQSFQVFVRGQKDVEKSLELSRLAADVARGRYTDLASATQLVNKAALGQIGALRRAGIQIDKNATSTQALAALTAAYGGAAVRYANSAAGAQDKLSVSVENLKESLGKGLLPALTAVVTVMDDGVTSAGLLADAFKNMGVSGDDAKKGLLGIIALTPGLNAVVGQAILLNKLLNRGKGGTPDVAGGAAAFDAQFGLGALTAAGTAGQKGTNNPFRIGKGSAITKQLSNRLISQEFDARQSGNRSTLKGVLAKEADFLQNALKDIRLKPGEVVALKQALFGVTEEIRSIDEQIIQDAKDKKDAAAAAKQKLKAANKTALEALKGLGDDIKSAVLALFDSKTSKIDNARALADAKKALVRARQIGGPEGILEAKRGLFDANRAIERQQIADRTFRVTDGPKGPIDTLRVGNIVININGAQDPDKIATQVLAAIRKRSKTSSGQSRGRMYPHTV